MKNSSVLISGDFVITNDFHGKILIERELIDLFNSSDFNIANLECPVTLSGKEFKIDKTGPSLKGQQDQIKEMFKKLNIHLATLANNHILDYGEKGISDTLSFCKSNNIETVGAGMNLNSAKKTFYKELNGIRISFVNFAENEWASAEYDSAGANPMNLIDNVKQIQEANKNSDVVIVLIHGGHEYYNLPSPRMQKQYRFYVDNGANLIVGHHPHCIGGSEVYNGANIYYSLGNFLFTRKSTYEDWYKGLVLRVEINQKKMINCELIPIQQNKKNYNLSVLIGTEKNNFLDRINHYSSIIKDEDLLEEEWFKFVKRKEISFINYFSPLQFIGNKKIRNFLIKSKLDKYLIKKSHYRLMLNLLRCEAHLDSTRESFKNMFK